MKALKTDSFSVAKLRHLDTLAAAEKARQAGITAEAGTATLGSLLALAVETHNAITELAPHNKECFASTIACIRKHWTPCFGVSVDTVKPEKVNTQAAEKFGNYLHTEAKWQRNKTKRVRRGYGPVTVNRTLEALHLVLRFAKARGFILAVPFELKSELGDGA